VAVQLIETLERDIGHARHLLSDRAKSESYILGQRIDPEAPLETEGLARAKSRILVLPSVIITTTSPAPLGVECSAMTGPGIPSEMQADLLDEHRVDTAVAISGLEVIPRKRE
jgi:hypothetical protein